MKRATRLLLWLAAATYLWLLASAPWQVFVSLPWNVPTAALASFCRPSPDLAVLLGVVFVGALAGRPRLWAHVGAFLLVVSVLVRFADEYLPLVFQRPFELADIAQLPGLVYLVVVNKELGTQVLTLGGRVGELLLLYWLAVRAFLIVVRALQSRRAVLAALVVGQALVVAAVLVRPVSWQDSGLLHLTDLAATELRVKLDPEAHETAIRRALAAGSNAMATAPHDLRGLAGTDVYVLVVESYGAAALRQPEVASHFAALWHELGGQLRTAQFEGVAGFVHPAITGGSSWLAHQELFTAVRVPRQEIWKRVLTSECLALPKVFQRAGWHTVEVMPAMTRHWPEGQAFYGFDESATQLEMPYDGTVYPWGRMPDQFALHWVLTQRVQPATQPLFATFVSVSSHAPWNKIPPLIADWRIDAKTFVQPPAKEHAVSWLDVPTGPGLVPAYRDGLEYALRAAVGFVTRLPRPSLVLVLGDHQAPIGFTEQPIDRTFDVPLHVFANRPELLAPWRAHGFADGWQPADGAPTRPLAAVPPLLLQLYSK
jgi:hypothetical protein